LKLPARDFFAKMDYELMLQQHVERGTDVTIGCHEKPPTESSAFRILGTGIHTRLSAAFRRAPNRLRITLPGVRTVARPMIDGLNA